MHQIVRCISNRCGLLIEDAGDHGLRLQILEPLQIDLPDGAVHAQTHGAAFAHGLDQRTAGKAVTMSNLLEDGESAGVGERARDSCGLFGSELDRNS